MSEEKSELEDGKFARGSGRQTTN